MFRASQSWSTRCLTGLLVMTLLLSLVPISASAVSSIGLSYSQPSVGRGSLKLYWDSAPNVEFYAYSVRDITTDESICSNERTSRTSASVSWTWENNHSYRIWAGACCTGNDPDNTSTWDYTGMDSFTVVGCPHTNTETAWDTTNHDVSYKSISDYEHKITGYEYEYCTKCFERIGKSHKVTETQAHVFDSDGDCTICNYRHSCQHKNTELVIASGFPSYKSCNAKEHTCTTLYDRVCANATCGKVVKLGDTRTTEDQPHRFNSSGRCKDCGYQKSYEKLQLGVSRLKAEAYVGDTIGASASASGGDGQYNYEWQISLNGQVIDTFAGGRDDSYSITASSAGQYVFTATVTDGQGSCKTASSSAITVRAKACEHTSYTDVPGTSKYTQISDAKHKKTTLMRRVCDSCKKTLNEYNKEVSESHHFSNGSCKECGAADPNAVCKHKNATDQFAYADITGQGNTQQHIVTDTYKVVCNDCGITIRTYETRRMADHNFNSDGVCSCGYAKPNTCDHANRKTTPLRVTGYVDKGSVGHEKTSLVRVECADCGIVLSAENTVTVVENHDFTYNNTCICGSQHVHDFNEGTRISGPTYSKLDDTQHSVTEVYRKTCKTCGYQTAETKTRQEKHNLTKFVRMDKYHDPSRKYAHIVIRSCSDCGAEAPYGYDTYKYCTLCFPTPAPTAAATPKPTDAPDVGKSAEEALKSFTKEAKQEGSELNKRYDEISDIKKDSEFVRISSAIAEAYADRGLLETAPEELYEMVTDWIGYTVDAAAGHFAPDETDEMLQSLIKSMLAQQVYDLTDGTYEAGKTMQSLADASISVYGELVTKHAKGAEIAGYASAGVGLIIDTVKDVNCSAEELAELSVLTASYDSNIAQLDAMIEQCGPNSQIGQACREIKAQMKCNYLAKAKSWAKAASGIGTSIVKTETSVGIGLLAGHAASDVVKKYASSAGSFLLGGQIGGLLTYNAGAHLKAKENLLLLSIVDAQVTSSMQEAYDDGSDALQPLTALWLTTRKTGLDEAEKYYQTYNSSLFNNVFNNDTVQTVKGNIQSTQDERQTVTEIAASMGITLYQPNSEVIRPENFEVGAGDAVYIYTSLSAAYLYSLPDKTSLKLMRVPAGTHMQVLDRTTDADGNSWIKVIYKGNVGYLNNSEQTIPLN